MEIKAAGRCTTKVSLMYPNQKKDMMVVFNENHRMIGVVMPEDMIRNARKVDENTNTAIIKTRRLKNILRSGKYYHSIYGVSIE